MNKFQQTKRGITLVEVMIFSVLLSVLLAGSINYMYTLHSQNQKLFEKIANAQRGFMATTAIVLLAVGSLAFTLAVTGASTLYADSVDRREERIQKTLNLKACNDARILIRAKDSFVSGDIYLKEFNCTIHM